MSKPFSFTVGSGRLGTGQDGPQRAGFAGLSEFLGDVSGAVVGHHPTALEALGVETGNGPTEKADHRWLLLNRQDRHVGKTGGVIHRQMQRVLADAVGAALLPVAGHPMAQLAEPGQGS